MLTRNDGDANRVPDSKTASSSGRDPLPGSPFHCVVQAGPASPQVTFVDGWSKESRAVDKHGKVQDTRADIIIAGDSVVLRPQICDALGNTAPLPDNALDVDIEFPDGTVHDLTTPSLKFNTQTRLGMTTYDIRHEATHAGHHKVYVRLDGVEIKNSPVEFDVQESVAEVKMCQVA